MSQAHERTYAESQRLLEHGVEIAPSDHFPTDVNERLSGVAEYASGQCQKVGPEFLPRARRLLSAALSASTSSRRVIWLNHAADALSEAYAPFAACKSGCSHCCHIPVTVSGSEARSISRSIGRALTPAREHPSISLAGYSSPCTFLKDDRCSIYEHRPAVCRAHLNMDIDDLLCRLLPSGQPVPVPYLDKRVIAAASLQIAGKDEPWRDIRQWFPAHNTETNA